MNKLQCYAIFATFLLQSRAFATPLTFTEAYERALDHSPEISASLHEKRATELSYQRSKLHWVPELGLKASAYTTNDPALNFFGTLSERQVQTQDFSPLFLNNPGYHGFQSISLGLDIPLFEGGRKSETVHALNAALEEGELTLLLKKRETSSLILEHYGNLVTDQKSSQRLKALKEQVVKVLSRYSIGNEANPIGYSGILGLKGLNNRIDAELIRIETSSKSHQTTLSEMTGVELNQINPSEKDLIEVIQESLQASQGHPKGTIAPEGQSIPEMLAHKKEEVIRAIRDGEKSRFLPKIGFFGNESLTRGSRDTGFATTAGLYLSWSLLSPDNFNQVAEQEERRLAAEKKTESAVSNTRAARNDLIQSERALQETLSLLAEGDRILSEQVKVASRLFQSGSISALNLSEVYNRRADLILNLRQVEKNWTELLSKKMILTQVNEATQ